MRLLATLPCLLVLCLAPALAQPTTTAPTQRGYVSYATEVGSSGAKVLLKTTDEEKKIRTVEVEIIFWRTGSQAEQQLAGTLYCADTYRCTLSAYDARKLDGEAAVRFGIANGLHVRPLSGTGDVRTPVWYKAGDGSYKAIWFNIGWYSPTEPPTVTALPDAPVTGTVN